MPQSFQERIKAVEDNKIRQLDLSDSTIWPLRSGFLPRAVKAEALKADR